MNTIWRVNVVNSLPFLIVLLLLTNSACSLFEENKETRGFEALLPDSTLFVSGVFTYATDTLLQGGEVILARTFSNNILPPSMYEIPRTEWPITSRQLVAMAMRMGVNIKPEKGGQLLVVNTKSNQRVNLEEVKKGVYRDVFSELKFEPGDSLVLYIELRGENYWSYTNVPPAPEWNVEDTVYKRLDLVDYYSTPKVYAEISKNDSAERAHL